MSELSGDALYQFRRIHCLGPRRQFTYFPAVFVAWIGTASCTFLEADTFVGELLYRPVVFSASGFVEKTFLPECAAAHFAIFHRWSPFVVLNV